MENPDAIAIQLVRWPARWWPPEVSPGGNDTDQHLRQGPNLRSGEMPRRIGGHFGGTSDVWWCLMGKTMKKPWKILAPLIFPQTNPLWEWLEGSVVLDFWRTAFEKTIHLFWNYFFLVDVDKKTRKKQGIPLNAAILVILMGIRMTNHWIFGCPNLRQNHGWCTEDQLVLA